MKFPGMGQDLAPPLEHSPRELMSFCLPIFLLSASRSRLLQQAPGRLREEGSESGVETPRM